MSTSDRKAIQSIENVRVAARRVGRKVPYLRDNPRRLEREAGKAAARLGSPDFKVGTPGLIRKVKPDGTKRSIHRFSVSDRIAFRAVFEVLWLRLEPFVIPAICYCTFNRETGTHPPRGVPAAHKRLAELRRTRGSWILKVDIEKFYNKVPRVELCKVLRALLIDSDAADLAEAVLEVPLPTCVLSPEERDLLSDGVAQGAATSPLFACLYLRSFDQFLEKGDRFAIRFVDDIVVACSSESEAEAMLAQIEAELRRRGLSLKSDKTEEVSPVKDIVYLGARITPRGRIRPTARSWSRLLSQLSARAEKLGHHSDMRVASELAGCCIGWMKARRHYSFRRSDGRRLSTQMWNAVSQKVPNAQRVRKLVNSASLRIHRRCRSLPEFGNLLNGLE